MTWIIIGLVLLAAFGPVLWLMPSKRDKRLSALRHRARLEGLVVELARLPKLDPEPTDRVSAGGRIREPLVECTAYRLNLAKRLRFVAGLRLLRGSDGNAALPGWVFDPERERPREHVETLLSEIARLLEALPEDVVGVEIHERQVTCYWLESPGSEVGMVTAMAAGLRHLDEELRLLDKRLEEEFLDEDS